MVNRSYPHFESHCAYGIEHDNYFASNIILSPLHNTYETNNMTMFNRYNDEDPNKNDFCVAYSDNQLCDGSDPNIYNTEMASVVIGKPQLETNVQNGTRFRLISHTQCQLHW